MSDQEEHEGVELETSTEKPVRLRAPIIVGGAALIVAVILLTALFAFTPREKSDFKENYEIPVADVSASTNEPLNSLPRDYDQLPPEPLPVEGSLPALAPVQSDPAYDRQRNEAIALEEKALASGVFFDRQGGAQGQRPGTRTGSALPEIQRRGEDAPGYAADLPADDRQNLQDQKIAFLNQFQGQDDFILNDHLHEPLSAYEVKAGTLIPAALITGINSDLPGDVIAQVSEHVYDSVTGRFLLIPQGARLYGRYDSVISYGQERVLVAWQRLVMPNGKSIKLDGMIAADPAGMSGLEDQVDHHFMKLAGAVLLSTAVSLSGNLADDNGDNSIGGDVGDTVAQEASRVGQRYVSKTMNIQPTIKIRGGAEVRVFVNKDMILEPYKDM